MHPLAVLVVALIPSLVPPAAPRLWAGLDPGPHAVGFSTTIERDSTRQLDGKPRPVQVACWFPSSSGTGTPLTFRDYFVTSASERESATASAEQAAIDEEKKFFASAGVDGTLVDQWLAEPVYARAGATPKRAAYPLVLVAQGNGQSAKDLAILSEVLASRGLVVCTTPSQARLGDRMTSEADVLPNAVAQAADLAVAERSARARVNPRPGVATLVAHSFGARSALLYAARHGAAALVSLDGGIGAAEARTWIDGASIDRARFTAPILHIYEEGDRAITPNMDLIRSLTASDRTLVKIDGLRHIDFTSLGFGAAAVPGLTGPPSASLAAKLRVVGDSTLTFIARALAGQPFSAPAAEAWLRVELYIKQPVR